VRLGSMLENLSDSMIGSNVVTTVPAFTAAEVT